MPAKLQGSVLCKLTLGHRNDLQKKQNSRQRVQARNREFSLQTCGFCGML